MKIIFPRADEQTVRNIFKENHENLVNKGTAQIVLIKTEVMGKNLRWEEHLQHVKEKMTSSFLSTMPFSKKWKEATIELYIAESQNRIMLVSKTQSKHLFIWQKMIFLRTHWEFWMAQMTRRGQLTTAAVSEGGNSSICHPGDTLPYTFHIQIMKK